ncbi:phist protein [Plasmodium cynomolgi strain B]|uniref:Phist protein n=1 Tax=Plasmodium cynomolgi (strain B) TaxID=1120755 RepID=K6UNK4_PLACD|nr:phist protein [Plasmodium cynomolgi strain B]GAB69578.1 phist protein [Plasmodium cynomolgi strain B]
MESCNARTVVFPVNDSSTNKRNGNLNYFSTPLGGVGEKSSRKSSGNFTLLKPMHILLIALLSLLLQNNHTHEQTGTFKLQYSSRYSRNLSEQHRRKLRISNHTKTTVDVAPNASDHSNDKNDISGSQVNSNIGDKIDDEAASVNGSKGAIANGSKSASANGSKGASANGSKGASANGSKGESANGNDHDSIVTLIKNKNTKDSVDGALKGSSNIKNDTEADSENKIMNTTGGMAISEKSTNQDNSTDSKNVKQMTVNIIRDLVNSLDETVRISQMIYIFIHMMTFERIKYDNLENDLIIYANKAANKLAVPEGYKTKELKKVQNSLKASVFEFEKKAYRNIANVIYSSERSRIGLELDMKYFTGKWNAFRKEKENIAKKQIETAMKNYQK